MFNEDKFNSLARQGYNRIPLINEALADAIASVLGHAPVSDRYNYAIADQHARQWVVNTDNDAVSVFDTATNTRLAEVAVGSQPRTLARAPDGRWWVIADRTQAPSGAGYALENRLVVSRVFPEMFRDLHVQHLADFFRDQLEGLAAHAPIDPSPLIRPPPTSTCSMAHWPESGAVMP
jgi:YVTN family beta-propeller protein